MPQMIAALWPHGQVAVADHCREDDIAAVATHILAVAPPRFALAGLSLGGYIAFAMLRQAPERIAKLARLNTSGRADTTEQTSGRETLIAKAEIAKMSEVVETLMLKFLHRTRLSD
jgi:pimeloyl-ACP methyl ester carboxylesterase